MEVNMDDYEVMSYQGLLSAFESEKITSLEDHVVIVDEAHRIRSSSG